MTTYYQSDYFKYPIEIDNIWWEIIVSIIDTLWRKIIYSWYDVISKKTESKYITKWILWWLINWIPKNVLIIWFWWWAYAKYLEDNISNINITWIDIDKTMFDIAKKEMKVKTNNFILDKNNIALDSLIKNQKKYDLIFIDVYWINWKIPENYNKKEQYDKIKFLLNDSWIISINYADYSWTNIWKYNKIDFYLKKIFWKNSILLKCEKNNNWNIVWIYNLNKKYSSEEINLKYLENVKKWNIIYDSNIIKNTFIKSKNR